MTLTGSTATASTGGEVVSRILDRVDERARELERGLVEKFDSLRKEVDQVKELGSKIITKQTGMESKLPQGVVG